MDIDRAMLDDVKDFDAAMVSNDEIIPAEMVNRLIAGENKLKVYLVSTRRVGTR